MSSRAEKKQRRKDERLRAEGHEAARQSRRRRLRLAGVALAGILAAAAVALAVSSNGEDAPGEQLAPGEVGGAFGQHYSGLAARRKRMKVTTMMDTMNAKSHYHPKLTILADGKPVPVPTNVGIDPRQNGMSMASLHTHDGQGTIHVEGMQSPTLGQFFAVWGVSFNANRLGPYRQPVRMWVNGKRSNAFGQLRLAKGQQIVLAVGRGDPTF